VFWQRADGSGAAERLTTPEKDTTHTPQSWSPDGKRFLFTEFKGPRVSLWTFGIQEKQASPYGGIEGTAVAATFSPDGRWVAYQSATTIFVQPFPATDAKYQIANGIHPFWSSDGKEVIFVTRGGLQAVSITAQPGFTFSSPRDLPRGNLLERGPNFEHNIEMLDGKRFVGVIVAGQSETGAASPPTIQVVKHWFEELKTKTPVK
jgi:hypothetical protein